MLDKRCRLALDTHRFKVPPIPSQAFLPWEVAKKFHSAGMPKSSPSGAASLTHSNNIKDILSDICYIFMGSSQ